jgi:hypothetical protein
VTEKVVPPPCERLGCRADATTVRAIVVGNQRVLEALCEIHAEAFDRDAKMFFEMLNRKYDLEDA